MNLLDWKVDDGGILFQKECVFGETFYVKYNEGWQSRDFEPFHYAVLVRLIFLFVDCIEFGQQLI